MIKPNSLNALDKTFRTQKCSVYVWGNHVHMLFQSRESGISVAMKMLLICVPGSCGKTQKRADFQ